MPSLDCAVIKQKLLQKCAVLGIPGSGIIELTPRCNLHCSMCYVRLTPEEMAPIGRERTADEWIGFAEEARNAGMTFLLLTGGEPTLRPDFGAIYEAITSLGVSISVNTNGTCITPALRSLWHKSPPAHVNLTLYGTSREAYSAFCGSPDSYNRICDALDWLRSEGILVHLNTTITPQNRDQWERFENFAQEHALELRMTNYCFPPRRRSSCTDCTDFERLSPEEAGELIVRDVLYRQGKEGIKARLRDPAVLLPQDCTAEEGSAIQCLAGRAQFWATWDGRLLPCGMLDFPSARPFETGFVAAWDSLKQACASIRLCPDCAACKNRHTCLNCAAVTYSETGSFDGKPDYMCKMNLAYLNALEKFGSD